MQQDPGCGLGCGMMLLVVGAIFLCLMVPWIGLPLGMLIVAGAILAAWLSGKKKGEGEDAPRREPPSSSGES